MRNMNLSKVYISADNNLYTCSNSMIKHENLIPVNSQSINDYDKSVMWQCVLKNFFTTSSEELVKIFAEA